MKNAMKKLFSLMLVAVLLVSAVPFQASAAANDLAVMVNGEMKSLVNTDSTSYDACLAAAGIDTAAYEITDVSCEYTDADGNVQTVSGFTAGAAAFELLGPTRVWFETRAKATEHTHSHTAEITKAATCTDAGVRTYVCDCGDTYTESIAALGHDLENGKCTLCPYVESNKKEEAPKEKYNVRFVVDGAEFCNFTVVENKTVKDPGTKNEIDYTELNKIGDTDDRTFLGWARKSDATKADFSTNTVVTQSINSSRTYYAIFKNVAVDPPTSSDENGITNKDNTNKVYLHVYLNGNASNIYLTKDITQSDMLSDDKTSNGEIWKYLTNNYYGPKDTALGVQIDGLYVNTGSSGTFPQNYYTDKKVSELDNVSSLLDKGYVHINVMLKNVALASSPSSNYTADSSNPKTGDTIMAPVAVMGLSVSALAVLFFLNKKRAY